MCERREWDSNPRRLAPRSFSRAVHSSALPSLQADHARWPSWPADPSAHSASSTTTPGPSRKTRRRSWNSMTSLRGRIPCSERWASIASRSLDAEADVVEAGARQCARSAVDGGRGMVEEEELDLLVDRCALEHQGDVIGLPVRDAHVAGDLLAGGHHGDALDEAEEPEELPGRLEIRDDHRHVVEALVARRSYGAHRPAFTNASRPGLGCHAPGCATGPASPGPGSPCATAPLSASPRRTRPRR